MNIRVFLILLSDIDLQGCQRLSYKECQTHLIVSHADCFERMQELLQSVIDAAPYQSGF
jgi:hypothetical protein